MLEQMRRATAADAAAIYAIYAPIVETTTISFELAAPSVEEMAQRIMSIGATYPWLVNYQDDMLHGYAYATAFRARPAYQWAVEVSVYVAAQAHRRGIARSLYTALFNCLRAQGFVCAYAVITLPNPASVQFHESCGFVPQGIYRGVGYKLGQWHDVGWWQYDLLPRTTSPRPPLPIGEVIETVALNR